MSEKEISYDHRLFINAYMRTKNWYKAYEAVYDDKVKNPIDAIRRIKKRPEVIKYLKECLDDDTDEAVADYQELKRFLSLVIRTNVDEFFHDDGRPKNADELTDEQRLVIKEKLSASGKYSYFTTYSKMDAVNTLLKLKLSTEAKQQDGKKMNVVINV